MGRLNELLTGEHVVVPLYWAWKLHTPSPMLYPMHLFYLAVSEMYPFMMN